MNPASAAAEEFPRTRSLTWKSGDFSVRPTQHNRASAGKQTVFSCGGVLAIGTLASNWTSSNGDYAKARRALGNS